MACEEFMAKLALVDTFSAEKFVETSMKLGVETWWINTTNKIVEVLKTQKKNVLWSPVWDRLILLLARAIIEREKWTKPDTEIDRRGLEILFGLEKDIIQLWLQAELQIVVDYWKKIEAFQVQHKIDIASLQKHMQQELADCLAAVNKK